MAGATVVMSGTGGGVSITGNSHTHENKPYLDQISTDKDNYIYLSQLGEVTNPDTGEEIVKLLQEKAKAGYADRAGIAHDLDEDSPVRKQFLSRLADDVAAGHITFEKGITALLTAYFKGGTHFGNFVKGLAGAMIDAAGNGEFENITARGYLKVFELIYNRLNALEGNTSFADVGTIDEISEEGDGVQVLTMRKRWDGDFTAFQPGDIVYGYVNNLQNGAAAEYYKTWAWIKSVDRAANTLTVVPYPDSEVPAGINHPLAASMIITRWGNNIEANAYTYVNKDYSAVIAKRGDNEYVNVRQSTFYISCEDGNIVELMGVNKPILEAGNYGTVLGKMPAGLLDPATQELVNKDQPYLFARGIIVQDLIRIDYQGNTTRTANYRGTWNAAVAASHNEYYRSTAGTYDAVTWNGDLWQCIASGTTAEPSEATGDWVNMTGGRTEKELRIWSINPSASVISVRKDEVRPETVGCTVSLHSSDNTTRAINSNYDLLQEGAQLYYSLDGMTWKNFVMGNTEPLDLEDGTGAIELEAADGDNILTVGGDDMATSEIGDRIYFELRDVATDETLAATQVPVVKDGQDGKTGDWTSYAFKQSDTQPRTPTDTMHTIPSGWQDAPTGTGKWWLSKALINGTTQKPGIWSTPVQCTAEDGKPGRYTDFKYGTYPEGEIPATPPPSRDPSKYGWYDTPPQLNVGYALWLIQGEIDYDNTLIGDWSDPVRISGEKGEKGEKGDPGKEGLMVYPAGYFDAGTSYNATSETAPVVKYGDNYYVLKRGKTYSAASMPDNRKTPAGDVAYGGSDARWQVFDKFNAIFADIVMAEFAKLGSAVIYGDWMISQQGTRNGADSTNYQFFKDGSFTPNVAINFRTGELRLTNGVMANFAKLGSAIFYGDWLISQQGALTKNGETDFSSMQYKNFADGSFTPNVAINFRTGEMRTRGTFNGFISRTPFVITPENIDAYTIKRTVPAQFPQNLDWRTFRLGLTGTRILFKGNFATSNIRLWLPALTDYNDGTYTADEIEEARGYIGNIIIIENDSNVHFSVEGNRYGTMNVPIGDIVQFECKMVRGENIGDKMDLKEYIEWESLPASKRTPKA